MAAPKTARPAVWDYAACYGLWALVLGLAFVALWTWRTTIEVLVSAFIPKRDAFAAVYIAAMLLAGVAVLVVVPLSEGYLRDALQRRYGETVPYHGLRRLVHRFARLAVPLVLVTLVAIVVQMWTVWHASPPPGTVGRRAPRVPPPPDALVPSGGPSGF
jgi:hypothetical protein